MLFGLNFIGISTANKTRWIVWLVIVHLIWVVMKKLTVLQRVLGSVMHWKRKRGITNLLSIYFVKIQITRLFLWVFIDYLLSQKKR